jgi:hypothetical protein
MGPGRAFSIHFRAAQVIPLLALQVYPVLSVMLSLKKKELFNIKEAHNHSFSHAVCPPFTLVYHNFWSMMFRQRTGDGTTVNRAR